MGFDFAAYKVSDSKCVEGLFYASMLGILDAAVMGVGSRITETPAHLETSVELLAGSLGLGLLTGFIESVRSIIKTPQPQTSQPAPGAN